jgi:hypothetical protein
MIPTSTSHRAPTSLGFRTWEDREVPGRTIAEDRRSTPITRGGGDDERLPRFRRERERTIYLAEWLRGIAVSSSTSRRASYTPVEEGSGDLRMLLSLSDSERDLLLAGLFEVCVAHADECLRATEIDTFVALLGNAPNVLSFAAYEN